MKKRNYAVIILALAGLLAGCGAKGASSAPVLGRADRFAAEEAVVADFEESAEYEYESDDVYMTEETAFGAAADGNAEVAQQDTNRKLITTVTLSAETEDFDAFTKKIEQRTQALGGYVESASVYNSRSYYTTDGTQQRNADFTIRIPAKKLNDFLSEVQEISNVLDHSRYVEDVTLHYVDTESRKKALVTERDRLLELVEQAETVEDIIALEERIATVRYELESIESRLRTYDNQIDYSTVNLYVTEVLRYTPVQEAGALVRMREGFVNSLYAIAEGAREFAVWFVVHLPQIVLLVAAVLIFVVVLRHALRNNSEEKRAERKAKRQQKKAQKKAEKEAKKKA